MWGVATSGHQVEGFDSNSQWAKWEAAGKTPQLSGRAVDGLHRYAEDFDLAKGMGLNAFRMSVEWARIEPSPGKYDQASINHYSRVIDAARARGLEPIVTLHHFTYPAWLDTYKQATGGNPGWEDVYTAVSFTRYARLMARTFGSRVKYYVTLNEPNMQAMLGYLVGLVAPGTRSPASFNLVMDNFAKAHAMAYDVIHEENAAAQVSTNVFRMTHSDRPTGDFLSDPEESFLDRLFNWQSPLALPLGSGTEPPKGQRKLDYVSFDYYFAFRYMEAWRIVNQWDWPAVPEGMYSSLIYYRDRYHLPIMIAENGMATEDGKPRKDGWTREAFLVNHVLQTRKAIKDGANVMGYVHWSLLDNYEWGSFKPRFGLYKVDFAKPELPRIPTAAVDVYRRIASANDVPVELQTRFENKRN